MWMSPSAVDTHALTLKLSCLRHRPSWMTTGMLLPTGTFVSVNVPSTAVYVWTSGFPVTSAPHWLHWTPFVNACTVPFGT